MIGADVLELLNEFRVPKDSGIQSNRRKLDKVSKEQLIKWSGLTDNEKKDLKKAKKADLQAKVFSRMLGRHPELIYPDVAIENTTNETANVPNTGDTESPVDGIVTTAISERRRDLSTLQVDDSNSSTEKHLWQKGAWLSFLINMENQCQYLGMPRFIW